MKSLQKLEEELNKPISKRKKAELEEKKAQEAYDKAAIQALVGTVTAKKVSFQEAIEAIKNYGSNEEGESNG